MLEGRRMPTLFVKETVHQAGQIQDQGKLHEMDQHQLLASDEGTQQIASFDQVKELGRIFISQHFNTVLPSTLPLPKALLAHHELTGAGPFWGKLALGADLESQFPVSIEVVTTPTGTDLRLQIVPIHYGALEIAQFGRRTDGYLALAAAAAVAPQFILALEGGIATTKCSSKKEVVTSISPDHGTPLAVTFDAFEDSSRTLDTAISITGTPLLSIKQAAHLHGQTKPRTEHVSKAAAHSKISAGVPLHTALRSELPKHALFIKTASDESGVQRIVSVQDTLVATAVETLDLSLMAAALGFTARVVGDSEKEKTIENVLKPINADVPLAQLVRT